MLLPQDVSLVSFIAGIVEDLRTRVWQTVRKGSSTFSSNSSVVSHNTSSTISEHLYLWKFSDWSPCSRTCGRGVRQATPVCFDTFLKRPARHPGLCPQGIKPRQRLRQLCLLQLCPPKWWAGPWQGCTCQGWRKRTVLCVRDGQQPLPDEFCDAEARPKDSQVDCRKPETCTRATGVNTNTFVNFGQVLEDTLVAGNDASTVHDVRPDAAPRDKIRLSGESTHWLTSNWSHGCDDLCYAAIRVRDVWCEVGNCPLEGKPRSCHVCLTLPACLPYEGGPWRGQKCGKCGERKTGRSRDVVCTWGRGRCNPLTRPPAREDCASSKSERWVLCSVNPSIV